MGIIGVALIVAALVFGGQELGGDEPGKGGTGIRIASISDFDPFGTGGEHPEDVDLAIDGNPTGTGWTTEGYVGAFGKPGVGVYVDAGGEVTADSVELRFGQGGQDVEIRAAPGQSSPPEDLDGWRLIGQREDVGTRANVDTPNAAPSRFFLIWLTKLPQNESGDFQSEIDDIRLLGSA
jgi:hypothetical protein